MYTRYLPYLMAALFLSFCGCAAPDPRAGYPEPRILGRELMPQSASAEVTEPTGAITLNDALGLALAANPDLAASSQDIHAAEGRRLQASLLPNPELDAEVEGFGGDLSGFSDSETRVLFSQPFLLGGKRAKRTLAASLERDTAGWQYEAHRLDLVTEVTVAFYDLLGAQRTLSLTEETVRIAEDVEAAAGKRVQAGAASPVEQTRAKLALSSARTEFVQAKAALYASRVRLSARWGGVNPRFTEAAGSMEESVDLPPLAVLRERLPDNPDLAGSAAAVAQRRATLDFEKSKRIPDVTVRAGYQYLGALDASAFIAGLAVPLPFFDRNQGGVAEAEARLTQSERYEHAVNRRAEAILVTAYVTLQAAVDQQATFEKAILPEAESAFDSIREGYQQGKFNYLDLLSAQKTLAETRLRYVRVLVTLNTARAKLERLIGVSLAALTQKKGDEE